LRIKNDELVLIDGTLREGEQSAGVFFTPAEKVSLLKFMDRAGIHIADCGMPAVSRQEFMTLKKLASIPGLKIRVGASVRCLKDEILLFKKTGAADCFIIAPVSDIHISGKFNMTHSEYVGYVKDVVKYAENLGVKHIHIVFEDATRAETSFIEKMFSELCRYDAEAFYICDTIGVATPELMGNIVERLVRLSEKNKKPGIGVHCHNDFGFALANTVAAYEAGARYVTFTQNGIGERAGNAKFHELVMYLKKIKKVNIDCDLNLLSGLSKKVEEMSGIFMPPTEPVVGFNAFRHESGIHVSGLLKNRKIYEEHRPEDIGRKNEFVVGKHSGLSIIDKLLGELFKGRKFGVEEKKKILSAVKISYVKNNKKRNIKMLADLNGFYSTALGGLSVKEFVEIVRETVE